MNFLVISFDPGIQQVQNLPAGAIFTVTEEGAKALFDQGWNIKPELIEEMCFMKMEGSPNGLSTVGAFDLATGKQYGFGDGQYSVQQVSSVEFY